MSDFNFEATSRFLETDKGRLHYHEAGSGPALLLLHGFGLMEYRPSAAELGQ